MENLIIAFDSIGEATLYVVDDETYDLLYEIYKNQEEGSDNGYSNMMEEFWKTLENCEKERGIDFQRIILQWNSHDHLKKSITFKRILQVLYE